MEPESLKKRINDLEQKHAEPEKFVLRWADEDEDPSKDGPDVIRLKWLDELEKRS